MDCIRHFSGDRQSLAKSSEWRKAGRRRMGDRGEDREAGNMSRKVTPDMQTQRQPADESERTSEATQLVDATHLEVLRSKGLRSSFIGSCLSLLSWLDCGESKTNGTEKTKRRSTDGAMPGVFVLRAGAGAFPTSNASACKLIRQFSHIRPALLSLQLVPSQTGGPAA
eukprot:763125-Hanusia_phi.AAC.5